MVGERGWPLAGFFRTGGGQGRRGLGGLVRLPDVLWKESDFEMGEVGGYITGNKLHYIGWRYLNRTGELLKMSALSSEAVHCLN